VSADNTILYVSNFKSDTIAIYSIDDGKPLGWIQVGRRPDALALSPNQNFLFVVDTGAGDVTVIRTAIPLRSNVPRERWFPTLTIIPVGQQPNAIAIKAFISSHTPTLP
jgi:DNA-binding beta-propeller fold protein YncE